MLIRGWGANVSLMGSRAGMSVWLELKVKLVCGIRYSVIFFLGKIKKTIKII